MAAATSPPSEGSASPSVTCALRYPAPPARAARCQAQHNRRRISRSLLAMPDKSSCRSAHTSERTSALRACALAPVPPAQGLSSTGYLVFCEAVIAWPCAAPRARCPFSCATSSTARDAVANARRNRSRHAARYRDFPVRPRVSIVREFGAGTGRFSMVGNFCSPCRHIIWTLRTEHSANSHRP